MITPNRYHLWAALECHAFSKAEAVLRFSAEEDGMWVQWQDYARLKAEVERLTERNKFLEQIDSYLQGANENAYEKRCDELEAEIERLTEDNRQLKKAFEIAESIIKRMGNDAENAAKEGKPSV